MKISPTIIEPKTIRHITKNGYKLYNCKEIYRFSGVGNSQADANRVAMEWLRTNSPYGPTSGFEVLPVMGEA